MTTDASIRITFLPQNKTADFTAGVSILDAARQLDLSLPAYCGGNGLCGRCKVQVLGDIAAAPVDLEFFTQEEIQQGFRLACLAHANLDCTVRLPQSADAAADILSEGAIRQTSLAAHVRVQAVACQEPTLSDTLSDVERLLQVLPASSKPAPELLPDLAANLREQNFSGAAILIGDEIVDFSPSATPACYGVAVDLGTTTVVSKLYDLANGRKTAVAARLNSQRKYGEDVISRISYAGRGQAETRQLQQAVIDLLNDSLTEMCTQAHIERRQIYEIVLAGNTVMQHLLLGVDAHYLAQMPYVPVFRQAHSRRAAALGLAVHPAAHLYLFPGIGRFVGGDTSAVLLSLADKKEGAWLAVDIGTNGEMILARDNRFWSTSAAAGPAFEGAHISQGMRAGVGAIDRIAIRDGRLHNHVIGEAVAVGICGSGLIDAVGTLLQINALDFAGRLQDSPLLPVQISAEQGPTIRFFGRNRGRSVDDAKRLA